MKETIFRGMRTDNGEWVEGYLWKGIKHAYIIPIKELAVYDRDTGKITVKAIPVIPETVGQYIGKNDINEKKIFEGDIVAGALSWQERNINGIVTFRNGSYGLLWYRGEIEQFNAFTSMCNVEYEVIGTAYENPELVGGK